MQGRLPPVGPKPNLFFFNVHPCIWGKVYSTAPVKRMIEVCYCCDRCMSKFLNAPIPEKKKKRKYDINVFRPGTSLMM